MTKLKKLEQHYIMEVRSLTFKGIEEEGTQFTCKHCKVPSFQIKGRYSSLNEAGKFSFNNTFDASNSRHKKKCKSWPDADATEPVPITFDMNAPPEKWKADELTHYLIAKAGPPPELASIAGLSTTNRAMKCTFRQPHTKLLSKELEISSNALYQFDHWRALIKEVQTKNELEDLLEECIDTLEREEARYEVTKSSKRPRGMFSRLDHGMDPVQAYHALLRLLRDSRSEKDFRLQGATISDRYHLSEYPNQSITCKSTLLGSLAGFALKSNSSVPTEGRLYVKPAALSLWLEILSLLPAANVRLGFYRGDASKVECSLHGFANATGAVDICVATETPSGVLCAVINDASDPRNVLPLGVCK